MSDDAKQPHLTLLDGGLSGEPEPDSVSDLTSQVQALPIDDRASVALECLLSLGEPELFDLSVRLSDGLRSQIKANARRALALAICRSLSGPDRTDVLSRITYELPPLMAAYRKATRRDQKDFLAYLGVQAGTRRGKSVADGLPDDPYAVAVVRLADGLMQFREDPGNTTGQYDTRCMRLSERFVHIVRQARIAPTQQLTPAQWDSLRMSCEPESARERFYRSEPIEG
jgi:hypothetical protein